MNLPRLSLVAALTLCTCAALTGPASAAPPPTPTPVGSASPTPTADRSAASGAESPRTPSAVSDPRVVAPSEPPPPANQCTTTTLPRTWYAYTQGIVTGTLHCSATVAGAGITVTHTGALDIPAAGTATITATSTTDATWSASVTPVGAGPSTVVVRTTTSDGDSSVENLSAPTTRAAALSVAVVVPKLRSESTGILSISTTPTPLGRIGARQPAGATGLKVTAAVVDFLGGARTAGYMRTTATDARGTARIALTVWRRARVTITVTGNTHVGSATRSYWIDAAAPRAATPRPAGAPWPAVAYPDRAKAEGSGANATSTYIPWGIWAAMATTTNRAGCLGYASLRYVQVNYWGFDGFRHRGELVVRDDAAAAVMGTFTDLYNWGFPIRQMILPERFGAMPNGWPGANDYAQMAADNTSAFNCRYVVGKEDAGVLSPHASGRAVDINTWENPYAAPTGVFPAPWWMYNRPGRVTGALDNLAASAFTTRGFFWGAWWFPADWQHFQR